MNYCQKCGTQIVSEKHYGTNYDHSLNWDFCSDCYRNGDFTSHTGINSFDQKVAPMVLAYTGTPGGFGIPYAAPFFADLDEDEFERPIQS